MSDTFTQIQYQHDYQPGRLNLIGQQKPAAVVELLDAAERAEEYHLLVADRYEMGRATQDELTEVEQMAEAAEDRYLAAISDWRESEADRSEMNALAHPGAMM